MSEKVIWTDPSLIAKANPPTKSNKLLITNIIVRLLLCFI